MQDKYSEEIIAGERNKNQRLDLFLASTINLSRSRIKTSIKKGEILINGHTVKPSYKVKSADRVSIKISSPKTAHSIIPAPIEFGIIYEDKDLIVVDKPAGLVVHPAPGHTEGTLVHGLLNHCKKLSERGGEFRPGIVHRLDKDTSGIMLVAKNDQTHHLLSNQFKERKTKKKYIAIVQGLLKDNRGVIDFPIGRHPIHRKKMAIGFYRSRPAFTEWEKIEEFNGKYTMVLVSPRTGRTHQIRVHMAYIGHPILGDAVYGSSKPSTEITSSVGYNLVKRQMLHAKSISFIHPTTNKSMKLEAPIPDDMSNLLNFLKQRTSP